MKKFIDSDFLLDTETARVLYHEHAKKMPIIDYHCHIDPQEIATDRRFKDITELWLEHDHYKWRLMRANGIAEKYITGDATHREKFQKWVETLEKAIGNPLYHWSHLELQRYFDYDGVLNSDTAEEVWQICQERLKQPDMSCRQLILKSNVNVICTTDDPVDDLRWHQMIREDQHFDVEVLPAWRPDRAMNLEKPDYLAYIKQLEQISGMAIDSFDALISALNRRMDFFAQMGCCISDHGLAYVMYEPAYVQTSNIVFKKRFTGNTLTKKEEMQFKTGFMLEMAKAYQRRGWVMQLHYGVSRNNNSRLFDALGPDIGIDCINNYTPADQLIAFLNALAMEQQLPKTILYSLNPNDNAMLDSIIGCFQDASYPGKIQHGSAWWFNDHLFGMKEQLSSLASQGILGNFIGMLTDSRSFLSYTRHEYFRRLLCQLIGQWVESGQYPADMKQLAVLVENISYDNARNYFGLNHV